MTLKKIVTLLLCLSVLAITFSSCKRSNIKKETNWNLNLNSDNKNPYGLYLAHNSLSYLFPGSKIEQLKNSYQITNLGYQLRKNEQASLILFIGMDLSFSPAEVDSLLAFVAAGHQVLLSSNNFDDTLRAKLNLECSEPTFQISGKNQKIFIKDNNERQQSYNCKYKHHDIATYFITNNNTKEHFLELGTNEEQHPNFIVQGIGKGKLFLHAAPIAFSNYFLLQQDNRAYLNTLFSYITDPVDHIYWSGSNYRQFYTSDWSVIWKHPATRYALLLSLLALGVYLLFQMKRKQKMIPIIAPLENSSVAFVEATGRLYYNKKNHSNLSVKMVQHFLEFVRSNYLLNTSELNADFVHKLAAKSGVTTQRVEALVKDIKDLQRGIVVDETFLHNLYKEIQLFYNGK